MDDLTKYFSEAGMEPGRFELDSVANALRDRKIEGVNVDITKRSAGPKSRFHELHFEIPSLRLLPSGKGPILAPAQDMHLREKPVRNPLYEETLPFCTRFKTDQPVFASSIPNIPRDGDLAPIVDAIIKHPGVSSLEGVAFDRDGETFHKFFLTTIWFTGIDEHLGARPETEHRTFMLSDAQWQEVIQNRAGYDWVDLLDHVETRACDSSWLLVLEKLNGWNQKVAAKVDAKWPNAPPKTIHKLFENRIEVTTLPKAFAERGPGKSMDLMVQILLPCQHVASSFQSAVNQLTEEDMIDFRCPDCGERVMEDSRERLLQAKKDREEKAKLWERDCDHQVVLALVNQSGTFGVEPTQLLDALTEAHEWLSLPSSVALDEIDPMASDESFVLLVELHDHFLNAGDEVNVRLDDDAAVSELLKAAVVVLRRFHGLNEQQDLEPVLPLYYERALRLWFGLAIARLALGWQGDKSEEEEAQPGG